jgi:SAM-dependent methyltransferase
MDRERAKLFDRLAERYDRTRPAYPEAVIDEVLGPGTSELSVLDVACGTGIASRQLAQRGARVLGVELNAGMAEVARRHGIPADIAAFETWDPAGRTFDLVTCAQAWHWLDPGVRAEKAASVLRAEGRLCLFWNVGHHPDGLSDALQATYRRVLPPDSLRMMIGYTVNRSSDPLAGFGAVSEELHRCGRFSPPQTRLFPWTRSYTRDHWLDELHTHSDHAALAPEVRATLFDEIGATIDGFGGRFDMPYVTILISATRT